MDHATASRARACVARQTDALIEQTFTRFVADMTAKHDKDDIAKWQQAAMVRFQGSVSILFSLESSAKSLIGALAERMPDPQGRRSEDSSAKRENPTRFEDAMSEAFRPDEDVATSSLHTSKKDGNRRDSSDDKMEPNGGTSW